MTSTRSKRTACVSTTGSLEAGTPSKVAKIAAADFASKGEIKKKIREYYQYMLEAQGFL